MKIREQAIKRADRATVMALDRFGAVIRQDSKRLIGAPSNKWRLTKKEVSVPTEIFGQTIDVPQMITVGTPPSKPRAPGQPPRARNGHDHYSLRNIRFISDYKKARVRIGPWRTSGKKYGTKTVPDLQEFGGVINTRVRFVPVQTVTSADLKRVRKNGRSRLEIVSSRVIMVESKLGQPATFKIPKRPFMRPAFRKHKSKATKIWADYYKAARRKR